MVKRQVENSEGHVCCFTSNHVCNNINKKVKLLKFLAVVTGVKKFCKFHFTCNHV